MSNGIRYDSLLVHHLAAALRERLVGRGCRSVPVRADDGAALLPLDGGEALRFDLHPTRGWIHLVPFRATPDTLVDAEVESVAAPPDERALRIGLTGGNRFRPVRRRVVVELHTNHWNLLVVDPSERIVFVWRPREAGGRILRAGEPYTAPRPHPRILPHDGSEEEAWAEWRALFDGTDPGHRAAALQRRFAYLGPVSAGPIVAGDEGAADARRSFERWWRLARLPAAEPVLLRLPRGVHPYPTPLPGIEAEPVPELLTAMARAAAAEPVETTTPVRAAPTRALADAARRRAERARQRVASLEAEREGVVDQAAARTRGDLLLANLAQVPRGTDRVVLTGWEGEEVEIPLDPALSPAENAERCYDAARRAARTAERIPALIAEAEREAERWERAAAAAEEGRLDAAEAAELAALEEGGSRPTAPEAPRSPFRLFRTSGGLEVRVGRGSADNDRLTFGHARPDDVWLHVRQAPGSHVVLRWGDAEQSPPARDLAEAAGLAAWFSKARTSGTVAVDWTRRKHVRKPRGAPPGSVIPQRVRTVFVEPDPGLERRLSLEGAAGGDGSDGADPGG